MTKTKLSALAHGLRRIIPAAALLCVGVIHAQVGSFGFDGKIIVPDPHFDYHPIEIRLLRDEVDGRTIAYTFTESTGSYAFSGLAPGSYFVTVRLDGYQEVRQRVDLTSRVGFTMRGVNIFLIPNAPDPKLDSASSRQNREAIDTYGKAISERAKHHFDSAAKLLESAVKLVPEYPDAHAELGEVYLELFRRVDAEREFRIALDLKPEDLRTLLNLGRLYLEEADVQLATGANPIIIRPLIARARNLLSDAVIRYPNSAMAEYLLGSAFFRAASYDNAELELNRAIALDKGMLPARIMLVNVFVIQQKWQNAFDMLDKFIAENPSSPYAREATTIRASVGRRLSPQP